MFNFAKVITDINMNTDTIKKAPVIITEGAIEQLNKLRQENTVGEDQGLRIGVKGGGCSGMTYLLAFDQQTDTDTVYEMGGLKVLMDRTHEMYVIGMEIDWQDGLNSRGFTFTNPNAKTTCGCGTSFSA